METAEGSMRTLAAGTRRGIHLDSPFLGAPRFGWPTKTPTFQGPFLRNLWEAVGTARKELGIKGGFEKLRGVKVWRGWQGFVC